jgi:hypothetical protein
VGLWKNIRGDWGEFFTHTRFEVNDGSRIRFWYGVWCGDQVLKVTFLDSFSLARCKDALVIGYLEFPSDSHNRIYIFFSEQLTTER